MHTLTKKCRCGNALVSHFLFLTEVKKQQNKQEHQVRPWINPIRIFWLDIMLKISISTLVVNI